MDKCVICSVGDIVFTDKIECDLGDFSIVVSGEKCVNCGEEYLKEEEINKLAVFWKK